VKHFGVFAVSTPMDLPRGWMLGLGLLLVPLSGLAGPDAREQFEFPNPKHWEEFVAKLEGVLQGNDPAALARFEPEARRALAGLKEFPGSDEYVAWLQERIDYISMAKYLDGVVPELEPAPTSINRRIPNYDLWLQRLRTRPQPDDAIKYVTMLRRCFVAAGVPAELVWLAEVESAFDPLALSPAGARGLYQLMPGTARELGLKTNLPDERTDPQKSAEAAARRLGMLYQRFGDWPLALAAYNVGAGYVQRLLKENGASTFAEIAPSLPLETRMYVPKVLAVLQVRAGVTLLAAK
jgi:membrane-bound lytic murein transglycosylase D